MRGFLFVKWLVDYNMKSYTSLEKKISQRISQKIIEILLRELPKGEMLMKTMVDYKDSPGYAQLIRTQTRLYLELNVLLGICCDELGYPLFQYEWNDSKPLEILAKYLPGLEATEWYQLNLGMMFSPKNHSWYKIISVLEVENWSNSQRSKEEITMIKSYLSLPIKVPMD